MRSCNFWYESDQLKSKPWSGGVPWRAARNPCEIQKDHLWIQSWQVTLVLLLPAPPLLPFSATCPSSLFRLRFVAPPNALLSPSPPPSIHQTHLSCRMNSMVNACILCNPFPTVRSKSPNSSAANELKQQQKLKFSKPRVQFSVKSSAAGSTSVGERDESKIKEPVKDKPIYERTPSNRPTRTPHSG